MRQPKAVRKIGTRPTTGRELPPRTFTDRDNTAVLGWARAVLVPVVDTFEDALARRLVGKVSRETLHNLFLEGLENGINPPPLDRAKCFVTVDGGEETYTAFHQRVRTDLIANQVATGTNLSESAIDESVSEMWESRSNNLKDDCVE
jgi:hypothetical protein